MHNYDGTICFYLTLSKIIIAITEILLYSISSVEQPYWPPIFTIYKNGNKKYSK